jgi:hypothetical protein
MPEGVEMDARTLEGPELVYASRETIIKFSKSCPGEPVLAIFECEDSSLGLATYQEGRDVVAQIVQNKEQIEKIETVMRMLQEGQDSKVVVVYLHLFKDEGCSEDEMEIRYGVSSFLEKDTRPEPGDITQFGFLSKGGEA